MTLDKSKFTRKHLGVFTGQEFIIRKLVPREYMRIVGSLPIEIADSVEERLRQFTETVKEKMSDDKEAERINEWVLKYGVVEPKIYFGEYNGCPEDQVHHLDLGGDADGLMVAIVAFTFEMPGLMAALERFSKESDGDPLGPDGKEIRAEAVELVT